MAGLFSLTLAALLLLNAPPDGSAIYQKHCAVCHDTTGQNSKTPSRQSLSVLSSNAILGTLSTGSMRAQGEGLSTEERLAVAGFLAARPPETSSVRGCSSEWPSGFDPAPAKSWNGWANGLEGSRMQANARITAADLPRLKLKWAFAFPNIHMANSQPSVAGAVVFAGSMNGNVYALARESGCTIWSYAAGSGVRTAILIDKIEGAPAVFFGDQAGNMHALHASTGKLIWKTRVEDHPFARLTAAPLLYEGVLYVPVSSHEEMAGTNAKYVCCTFRGSIVALQAATGSVRWKSWMIEDVPRETGRHKQGGPVMGPSGAAVWSTPSVDKRRGLLYVATGNNYTGPSSPASDAVAALDLLSGKKAWLRQLTPADFFNISCSTPEKLNCETAGPDHDIGATPVLGDLGGGKSVVVVGQKSGVVYGLDPDRGGEVIWQTRVGRGGALGGVEWGLAADRTAAYVPVSDILGPPDARRGGLHALRLSDGKVLWSAPAEPACPPGRMSNCHGAQPAAATVSPGLVWAGSYDGHVRAYSAEDGKVLWSFQTAQKLDTVNGVAGEGGSIDGPGPVLADGMMFVVSGYGTWRGMPGNLLLAFGLE